MTQKEIVEELQANYTSFTSMIFSLDEADFLFSANDKWTPGEQAEHILRSIKPVNLAFGLPQIFLKVLFGKSNRPSKTFDALVHKYKEKLAAGGRASGRFIPKPVAFKAKEKICTSILAVNEGICKKLNKRSEKELDTFLLPHPLLGKLTLREMLYFNIHHVKHHKISVAELLERKL